MRLIGLSPKRGGGKKAKRYAQPGQQGTRKEFRTRQAARTRTQRYRDKTLDWNLINRLYREMRTEAWDKQTYGDPLGDDEWCRRLAKLVALGVAEGGVRGFQKILIGYLGCLKNVDLIEQPLGDFSPAKGVPAGLGDNLEDFVDAAQDLNDGVADGEVDEDSLGFRIGRAARAGAQGDFKGMIAALGGDDHDDLLEEGDGLFAEKMAAAKKRQRRKEWKADKSRAAREGAQKQAAKNRLSEAEELAAFQKFQDRPEAAQSLASFYNPTSIASLVAATGGRRKRKTRRKKRTRRRRGRPRRRLRRRTRRRRQKISTRRKALKNYKT